MSDNNAETMQNEAAETIEPVNEVTENIDEASNQNPPEKNPEAELQVPTSELDELKKQVIVNMEGWQRARAEFANYKKRAEREKQEGLQRGALDAITKLLPIIDDFERAMENVPEDLQDNPWVNGTSMILQKFNKLLEDYDVVVIDPVGEPFDPRQHEGIGMEDSDEHESGYVTMTLQKGYSSGDRILRPALVRVAN